MTIRRFKTTPTRPKPTSRRRRLLARLAGAITAFALGTGLAGSALSAPTPVFSAYPAPPDTSTTSAPGNAITASGDYTYEIPIAVPPGRLSATPRVAFSYASSGPVHGSELGQGWSISGAPAIRVDTFAAPIGQQQGYVSELAGGALLVRVDDDRAGDVLATYRAENDPTFARYELLVDPAPYQWRVRLQDGSKLYFGDRSRGPAGATTGPVHLVAPLALYEDAFGNVVEYQHRWALMPTGTTTSESQPRAWYYTLDAIRYGRNDNASLGHHAIVAFEYEEPARCLPFNNTIGSTISYRTGELMAEGVLTLGRVTTWSRRDANPGDDSVRRPTHLGIPSDFSIVREYTLTHDRSAARCDATHAPRRILTSIKETAWSPTGEPVHRQPTRFEYGSIASDNMYRTSEPWTTRPLQAQFGPDVWYYKAADLGLHNVPLVHSMLADMNGDGRPDRIELASQPLEPGLACMATWWENTGDGFTLRDTFWLPSMRWKDETRDPKKEFCSLGGQVSLYAPDGDGGDDDDDELKPSHLSYGWEDVNHDGAVDLVIAYYRNPDHISEARDPFVTFSRDGLPTVGGSDVSAAWVEEVGGARSERGERGFIWYVFLNDGNGELAVEPERRDQPLPHRVSPDLSGGPRQVGYADYNGDGYQDALFHYGDGTDADIYELQVLLGDEQGFFHGDAVGEPFHPSDRVPASTASVPRYCASCPGSGYICASHPVCEPGCTECGGDLTTVDVAPGIMGTSYGEAPFYVLFTPFGDPDFDEVLWSFQFSTARPDINGDGLLDWMDRKGSIRLHTGGGIEPPGDWSDLAAGARDAFPHDSSEPGWEHLLGWQRKLVGAYTDSDETHPQRLLYGRSYEHMAWTDWDGDGLIDKVFVDYDPSASGVGAGIELDLHDASDFGALWSAPLTGPPAAYVALNFGGLGFLAPRSVSDPERLFAIAGVTRHLPKGRQDTPDTYATQHPVVLWSETEGFARDFTGDGLTDYMVRGSDGVYRLLSAEYGTSPPGLLTGIETPQGSRIDIEYAASSDADVVVPDYARGRVMRRPKFVTSAVTVSPRAAQPSMRASYRYVHPVWNRDPRGRDALRGFERVERSTGEQVAESIYDFSQSFRGLLVESAVRTTGSSPVYHSIERTAFRRLVPFGDELLAVYAPERTEALACRTGQSYAACETTPDRSVTETTWVPKASGRLFVPFAVDRFAHDPSEDGLRRTETLVGVWYSATDYRANVVLERQFARSGGAMQPTGKVMHIYDPTARVVVRDVVTRDAAGVEDTTEYSYDMATGLLETTRKPKLVAEGAPNVARTIWDPATRTYATQLVNEVGHEQWVTRYDHGLGVALATRGPSYKCPGHTVNPAAACGTWLRAYSTTRTDFDGLGRALGRWISLDSGDGYVEQEVEQHEYRDHLLATTAVPNLHIARTLVDRDGESALGWATTETRTDGLGRITSTAQPSSSGTATTTLFYDARGRVTLVAAPDPSRVVGASSTQVVYDYAHDPFGRVVRVRFPRLDGAGISDVGVDTAYDGFTTTVTERVTDGGPASTTVARMNHFGETVEVRERLDTGSYAVWSYGYDGNGNLHTIDDPDGVHTLLVSDWLGNRTLVERGGRRWEYRFDGDGNMIAAIDPHGALDAAPYTTTMRYDALDRITTRTPATKGLTAALRGELKVGPTTFGYDGDTNALGQRTSVSSPVGRVVTRYDARGMPTERTQQLTLGVPTVAMVDSYARSGQLWQRTHADGPTSTGPVSITRYRYDDAGRFESVSANRKVLKRITLFGNTFTYPAIEPNGVLAHVRRNPAGMIAERYALYRDGDPLDAPIAAFWDRDRRGKLSAQRAVTGFGSASTLLAEQEYAWFDSGSPSALSSYFNGVSSGFAYTYDDRHMIASAEDDTGYAAAFGYTPAGRMDRATVSLPTTAVRGRSRDVVYEYSSTNPEELVGLVDAGGGDYFATVNLDSAGNVEERIVDGHEYTYTYDGENRLRLAVDQTDGKREVYYYLDGARVAAVKTRWNGQVLSIRRWFGDTELHYDATGRSLTSIVDVSMGGEIVGRIERTTEVEATVSSAQGHVLVSVNAAGEIQGGHIFGPFGEILEAAGDLSVRTDGFNGKDFDEVSGWSYYGARYYDPDLLQWNRIDPLLRFTPELALDAPRQQNLYTFALNNPISYVDPDGEIAFVPIIIGAAVAAGFELGRQLLSGDALNGWNILAAAATGAVGGYFGQMLAAAAPGLGVAKTLLAGATLGVGELGMYNGLTGRGMSMNDFAYGVGGGLIGGGAVSASASTPKPTVFQPDMLEPRQATLGGQYHLPTEGTIDPSRVRFTQDSVSATFRNGGSVDDVARRLHAPDGDDLARSFPPIRLVELDGQLFTLDNRRLAVFSAAQREVPYQIATADEIAKEWHKKFTTTAEQRWGWFITIRPPRRQ